ncbi:N-acetyltransferase family protein [Pseudomonas sp. Pseusp97]|uniref:GNAT family N-acetyltransferase n=1 Tax=Pseudomonas sp. Pseusp97 TaxID=3243065 RepID=UPI0039A68BA5
MRLLSIREAQPDDVPAVLEMMRALAGFEGYLDAFAVDADALLSRAFGPAAQCQVLVAETAAICGYAVVQNLAFTFDLRPSIRLKELYVVPEARGGGVGQQLLRRVAQYALAQGAGRLLWDVLAGNDAAERFYSRLGGRRESRWIAYRMDDRELLRLAGG